MQFYKSVLSGIVNLAATFSPVGEDRWLADVYAENSFPQQINSAEVVSNYQFKGDERILDVGSKDGVISEMLAHQVPNGSVLSIDISPAMFEYAKNRATNYPDNLTFEFMDAVEMEFHEEFDLVTALFTLHWVHNKKKALENIVASLVPGGRFLMLSPYKYDDYLQEAVDTLIQSPRWQPYFEKEYTLSAQYHSKEELHQMLHDVHLTPIKTVIRRKLMLFSSRQAYQKTLLASFAYIDLVPEELREVFLDEIVDEYLRLCPPDSHNRVFYRLELCEIVAVKNP